VPGDLLGLRGDRQLAAHGSLDRAELREQVLVFLLAGHETTATALAFTLHLLARHPKEQERVREDRRGRRGLSGTTYSDAGPDCLPPLGVVLRSRP
jgi:cytochrome P450